MHTKIVNVSLAIGLVLGAVFLFLMVRSFKEPEAPYCIKTLSADPEKPVFDIGNDSARILATSTSGIYAKAADNGLKIDVYLGPGATVLRMQIRRGINGGDAGTIVDEYGQEWHRISDEPFDTEKAELQQVWFGNLIRNRDNKILFFEMTKSGRQLSVWQMEPNWVEVFQFP